MLVDFEFLKNRIRTLQRQSISRWSGGPARPRAGGPRGKTGRFSHSGYDELRSQVESTYGEMVVFSNTDDANSLNENTSALDFARTRLRIGVARRNPCRNRCAGGKICDHRHSLDIADGGDGVRGHRRGAQEGGRRVR